MKVKGTQPTIRQIYIVLCRNVLLLKRSFFLTLLQRTTIASGSARLPNVFFFLLTILRTIEVLHESVILFKITLILIRISSVECVDQNGDEHHDQDDD